MIEHVDLEIIDAGEDEFWERKFLSLMHREEDMLVGSTVQQNTKLAHWIRTRNADQFKWPNIH